MSAVADLLIGEFVRTLDERHRLARAPITSDKQLGEIASRAALVEPELAAAGDPVTMDESRPVDVAHVTVGAGLHEANGHDRPVLALALALFREHPAGILSPLVAAS